jgi:hypothetical protein
VLQIKLGANRVLPLIRFRGAVRPVIIAGDRSYVERCIREGEQFKDQLRQRGVSGRIAGCRHVCTLILQFVMVTRSAITCNYVRETAPMWSAAFVKGGSPRISSGREGCQVGLRAAGRCVVYM